jgi:hypothetical protein
VAAATNAGGAGKRAPEHPEALRGAPVVILPDNDEPRRKHARQVAAALHRIAPEVCVVALPGLPPNGGRRLASCSRRRRGAPLPPNKVSRDVRRLRDAAGLPPLPLHALRHTAVSVMMGVGVSLAMVSRVAGHERHSLTVDGHLTPEAGEAAWARVNAFPGAEARVRFRGSGRRLRGPRTAVLRAGSGRVRLVEER